MDLSHAMDPFVSSFYNYRGHGFKAHLLAVPMEESSTYFFLPRRILKTYPNANIRPGDQVRDEVTKRRYLVGENGQSLYSESVIHNTFKLFQITHPTATLKTRVTVTDPLTDLKKVVDRDDLLIPVVIEFTKMQEDEMRIGADLVRIIATHPLKPNDIVNEYTIINSEPQLGLYFATARRT